MILKRSLILIAISIVYYLFGSLLSNFMIKSKEATIFSLEEKQKIVNEQFITAQILSQKLDNVYTVFEKNLANSMKDDKNKEASMEFLKYLTDVMEKYSIKLNQIIPDKKIKKGLLTHIPYTISFSCDYEKFGQFINQLESADRIILIKEIIMKNNIDNMKSADEGGDMEIEMEIVTITINKSKNI
ncbi:type 4a pilus biogenesis protein PilO [Candidatus Marinimicrobia bacterium]|nr:type 4a pilus biogenesis protein PilO [Candidatus Neomarinimicrobiota bacterium]